MPSPKPDTDITRREDVTALLRHFYQRAMSDPIIGFYFTRLSHFELDSHLPRVCDFWMGQLFGDTGYQGRNFEVHQRLHRQTALTPHHFHRWRYLFEDSISALYAGPIAETMKERSRRIAQSMADALEKQPGPPSDGQGLFIPDGNNQQQ